MFKLALKFFSIGMLSTALITNSIAETKVIDPTPAEFAIHLEKKINEKHLTFKQAIPYFSKNNLHKIKELEAYLLKHPDYKEMPIPKVTVNGDKLVFTHAGKNISFSFEKESKIFVSIQDKTVVVNNLMSPKEMEDELFRGFNNLHFSFFNLLIEDAHADPALVLLLVFVTMVLAFCGTPVYTSYTSEKFGNMVASINTTCARIDIPENYLGELKDLYNNLAEKISEKCLGNRIYDWTGPCSDAEKAKACLKQKLDLGIKGMISNMPRPQQKSFEYHQVKDRYLPSDAKEK